jgi:hypothetical protein
MADTDPRYSLPDTLRERLEAAAREDASTPEELVQAALEADRLVGVVGVAERETSTPHRRR